MKWSTDCSYYFHHELKTYVSLLTLFCGTVYVTLCTLQILYYKCNDLYKISVIASLATVNSCRKKLASCFQKKKRNCRNKVSCEEAAKRDVVNEGNRKRSKRVADFSCKFLKRYKRSMGLSFAQQIGALNDGMLK